MKFNNLFGIIIMMILFIGMVMAGNPYLVDENMNLETNDIYNATNINATTFYGNLVGAWNPSGNVNMNGYDALNVGLINGTNSSFNYYIQAGNDVVDVSGATMQGSIDMNDNNITNILRSVYNITGCTEDAVEGTVCWNVDEHTLNIVSGLGNVIQVGQEMTSIAKNADTVPLLNGQVVSLVGSSGDRGTIIRADASNTSIASRLAVVTIASCSLNAECPVTTFGRVRNMNTSAWVTGTLLYLSDDGSGNLTSTAPSFPNYIVTIAAVIRQHASDGIIFVGPNIDYTDGVTLNSLGVIANLTVNGLIIGTLSNEADLNVNSSNYWDALNTPADFTTITATGLITGGEFTGDINASNVQNMDISCGADTYFTTVNFTDESAICTGISDVYLLNNGDTGTGPYIFDPTSGIPLTITQDNAATGIFLDQNGEGIAFSIDSESTTSDIINLDGGTITSGIVLDIIASASKTGTLGVVRMLNSGDATVLNIDQDGNGISLNIDSESTTSDVINIDGGTLTSGIALDIIGGANKIGTFGLVRFQNQGTGTNLLIDQDGEGLAFFIDSEATTTKVFQIDAQSTNNDVMYLQNNGQMMGATLSVFRIIQNNAASTSPDMILLNKGTGNGLFIDQNGNGISLNIDSEATTANGINIDVVGTGNAIKVTAGDVVLSDNLDVAGDITGKNYYGNMYIYQNTDETTITSADVYYNVTVNMTVGLLNGFTYSSGTLTVTNTGKYKLDHSISFSGGVSDTIHGSIGVNGVMQEECHISRKLGTGGDVGNAGSSCILSLTAADIITLMVENVGDNDNIIVADASVAIIGVDT